MADIFIRALPRYAPDLIVLLGLYLLLLGRWKKQGRRRVLVYTVFSVYMLGVLWVTVLPVLSMLGIHHAYAPMNLEPFRDLRLGYGNAERQVFLNVLMTVPFGILWPVVRRGKAGGVPYGGGGVSAEPVHRAGPTAAAHSTDVGHHRPDLQHCRRADRLRAVPAVEKSLGLLDVKNDRRGGRFLLIAGLRGGSGPFWPAGQRRRG